MFGGVISNNMPFVNCDELSLLLLNKKSKLAKK